jgi:hypothetical protein
MFRTLEIVFALAAIAAAATVSGELTFERDQLALGDMNGMTTVALGRYVSSWEIGAPAVPIALAQLVVPQQMRVTGVRVDEVVTETIPGVFDVYPVQEPIVLSDPGPYQFVAPDPKYYGQPAYPAGIAVKGHQGSMFGYNIASVFIAPVQHDGANRTLVFHPLVRFTLELEPADLGYLRPGNRTADARRRIEAQIASIVLNPQDVATCAP